MGTFRIKGAFVYKGMVGQDRKEFHLGFPETKLDIYLNALPFALDCCVERNTSIGRPMAIGDKIHCPYVGGFGWSPRYADGAKTMVLVYRTGEPEEMYFFRKEDDGRFYPADDDPEVAAQLKAEIILMIMARGGKRD